VGGYEPELLLVAIGISLLLTGPGRISIEWDVLKKEIFPRGKVFVQQQKDAVKKLNGLDITLIKSVENIQDSRKHQRHGRRRLEEVRKERKISEH
jgi:hypothetical protein